MKKIDLKELPEPLRRSIRLLPVFWGMMRFTTLYLLVACGAYMGIVLIYGLCMMWVVARLPDEVARLVPIVLVLTWIWESIRVIRGKNDSPIKDGSMVTNILLLLLWVCAIPFTVFYWVILLFWSSEKSPAGRFQGDARYHLVQEFHRNLKLWNKFSGDASPEIHAKLVAIRRQLFTDARELNNLLMFPKIGDVKEPGERLLPMSARLSEWRSRLLENLG